MLKILPRIPNQDNYIINKSPTEQYSNSKIKIKKMGEKINPPKLYENAIIVFDDLLDSSVCKNIDQFFIKRRHKILDIYYLSESYFDLPKRTIRNNSN